MSEATTPSLAANSGEWSGAADARARRHADDAMRGVPQSKDESRAQRIADDFQSSDHYEHLLQLRDNGDARWQQAGTHSQLSAAMYEAQRATARQNGRNL